MVAPNNPVKYRGTDVWLANYVSRNRRPTGADYRQPETGRLYPIFAGWQVGKDPVNGTEGELWLLTKIVANVAYWEMVSGAAGTVVAVRGDDAIIVNPDVNGIIDLDGNVVPNATNLFPVWTRQSNINPNAEVIDVQLTTEDNIGTGTSLNAGLAWFNQNQFDVDVVTGGVSLIGGGVNPPVSSLTGDDGLIVVADGTGNIDTVGGGATSGIVTSRGGVSEMDWGIFRWVNPSANNWTVVVRGSTVAGVGTYVKQHAVYARIGRMIWFTFDVQWSNHTGTGDMQVTGFPKPFTLANTNYPTALFTENVTLPAGFVTPFFVGSNSQTIGTCYVTKDATTKAAIQMPGAGQTGTICAYGYYFTDESA